MGYRLSVGSEQLSAIVPRAVNRPRAFSTLATLPEPPEGLSRSSSDEVELHSREVLSWLSEPPRGGQPIGRPLDEHLRRCQHVLAHGRDGDDDTSFDVTQYESWGWQANVIWVTSDHRILDPAGRLLIDDQASAPDPLAVIPFPVEARQRQSEVAMILRNRLIDPVEGILPVRGENEIDVISSEEVARRALALFLVATRAESILSGQTLDVQRMRQRCPLGYAAMSPHERAYFDRPSPASTVEQTRVANVSQMMIWRYEALATLQWALGMQFELPWPDERADLTAVTRLMIDIPDAEIVEQSQLRRTTELLHAAELHYQAFHAIAVAQQSGQDSTGIFDPGIVCERLTALAWIGRLAPAGSDWDATVQWVENGCP